MFKTKKMLSCISLNPQKAKNLFQGVDDICLNEVLGFASQLDFAGFSVVFCYLVLSMKGYNDSYNLVN